MQRLTLLVGIAFLTLSIGLSCQQESDATDTGKPQDASGAATVTLVQAMDAYHRVLRPLMHQALPEKNLVAFKENSEELLRQAEKIDQAVIPEKFSEQREKIEMLCASMAAMNKYSTPFWRRTTSMRR